MDVSILPNQPLTHQSALWDVTPFQSKALPRTLGSTSSLTAELATASPISASSPEERTHTVTAQWFVTQQTETDVSMNMPAAHPKRKRKHKPVCAARIPSDSSCKTPGAIYHRLGWLNTCALVFSTYCRKLKGSPGHNFHQFKEEVTRCSCLQPAAPQTRFFTPVLT